MLARGWQNCFPQNRFSGDDGDFGLSWQFDIVISSNCVNQYAKLETVFAEGLNAHARTTTNRVAKVDGNLIALAQESADYLDVNGFIPGANITLHVVLDMQHSAVRSLYRDIVWCRGIIKLRFSHIAGEAMYDFNRAGVIDSIVARGIGQFE